MGVKASNLFRLSDEPRYDVAHERARSRGASLQRLQNHVLLKRDDLPGLHLNCAALQPHAHLSAEARARGDHRERRQPRQGSRLRRAPGLPR